MDLFEFRQSPLPDGNMDGIGDAYEEGRPSFWKKSSKAVPGRPSPKRDIRSNSYKSSSTSTSFQDFQESVNDAWDLADDDICGSAGVTISSRVSQSAALSVINNHRNTASVDDERPAQQPVLSEQKKTEAIQRLALLQNTQASPTVIAQHTPHHARQFPGRPQPLRGLPSSGSRDGEESSKFERFQPLLESTLLNLEDLRQLSWSGIPVKVRAITWRLLSGYVPANLERRQQVLEQKRQDYWNLVKQYFDTDRDEAYEDTYRQIHIDIPRMSPLIALFQQQTVQEMFERILYIWAIRHPASGYVQGMNDLVTPFYIVFLQEAIPNDCDLDTFDVSRLSKEQRDIIEADSFWCLSKFLDGIQDNYIFAQLGIQRKVNQLKELIQRIDTPLHRHLQQHGVDYLQFSFRWMNNLLTRELPLYCTIRLWDTYLAESDGFASFQLYVCAAFLMHWRQELLLEKDFQGLMLMLQNLPTQRWTDSEISIVVAEAYRLKFTFADAPNHLQSGDR